jgi:RHS repeat-associated protein
VGYDVLGQLTRVDENSIQVAEMAYDATGRLAQLEEGGESRLLITDEFEWLFTSKVRRIRIHLGGTVIASHEASYNPGGGGGCSALLPALSGDWGAPFGLLAPGLFAFMLLQLGFALRRRPRGARLRPVLAAGTAGVFVVATSLPFPGVVPEARAADWPGVTYYHGDHLGSSVVITDETGAQVEQILYRPFGQAAPGSDSVPEFGFTGQRFVESLGIYDYGARWYAPTLGRFLQPDPVIPDLRNPQSINPYSYVLNNPLGMVDPTGTTSIGFSDDPLGSYALGSSNDYSYDWPSSSSYDWLSSSSYLDRYYSSPSRSYLNYNSYLNPSYTGLGRIGVSGLSWHLSQGKPRQPLPEAEGFDVPRFPDFYSGNLNVAIPTPWTGTLVGVTGAATLDKYGKVYVGFGPNIGKAWTGVSGSLTAGWLNQTTSPTEETLQGFLAGHALNIGGGYWGGGSLTYSPTSGSTATNLGFFTPQIGIGYTYSWLVGDLWD